ncbi:hypothetical protein BSKO_11049 [Bryopsis sp. KO-2023]|nr:hypothetical protein BSKO_11049 [Bryopsis sp. KO-2023]
MICAFAINLSFYASKLSSWKERFCAALATLLCVAPCIAAGVFLGLQTVAAVEIVGSLSVPLLEALPTRMGNFISEFMEMTIRVLLLLCILLWKLSNTPNHAGESRRSTLDQPQIKTPASATKSEPSNPKLRRLAIVLDLDRTLLRTWPECVDLKFSPLVHIPPPVQRAMLARKLDFFKIPGYIGVWRPGAQRFIRELASFGDLYVSTLASAQYALDVREALGEGSRGLFRGMATREDTDRNRMKDLSLFGHDLERLVIVDDDWRVHQKENVVSVAPFDGDCSDTEFTSPHLLARLKALNQCKDVRDDEHGSLRLGRSTNLHGEQGARSTRFCWRSSSQDFPSLAGWDWELC